MPATEQRNHNTPTALCFITAGIAYWTYANVAFSLSMPTVVTGSPTDLDPTWFTLTGNLIALGLMGVLPWRHQRSAVVQSGWLVGACICMVLGVCTLGLVDLGLASHTLRSAGGLVGGVGQGFCLVFFAELFARVSLYRVLLYAGIQQGVGALLYLAASQLPTIALLATDLALAGLLTALLWLLNRRLPLPQITPASADASRNSRGILVGVAAAAALVGVCYGLTLSLTATRGASPDLPPINLVGAFIGGSLLILSALLFKRRHIGEYFYRIVVPLLGLGLATIPLLSEGLVVALPILIAVGSYFFGLLWFLVVFTCRRTGLSVTRTAALAFFCWELGHLAARSFFGFLPASLRSASSVSVLMLFAIVVFLVVYLPRQNRYEENLRRETHVLRRAMACDHLADRLQLTPRERDVLPLLVQGLSAKAMADRLVVSEATVNTHVQHVYQKANIHTREELASLLASEESAINRVLEDDGANA